MLLFKFFVVAVARIGIAIEEFELSAIIATLQQQYQQMQLQLQLVVKNGNCTSNKARTSQAC